MHAILEEVLDKKKQAAQDRARTERLAAQERIAQIQVDAQVETPVLRQSMQKPLKLRHKLHKLRRRALLE